MKKVNPFQREFYLGDSVMVHAYKYNGWLYRTWEYPIVVENRPDFFVLALQGTKILSAEENSVRAFHSPPIKSPKFWFFFKNCWFNVIATFEKKGISTYINVASPYLYEEGAVKYYDFDLDFKISPTGRWKEVDLNEYAENRMKYQYPFELTTIIQNVERDIKTKINQNWLKQWLNHNFLNKLQNKYLELTREEGVKKLWIKKN